MCIYLTYRFGHKEYNDGISFAEVFTLYFSQNSNFLVARMTRFVCGALVLSFTSHGLVVYA